MLENRHFSYKTITQTSLNTLIENARKEKYYDLHKDLFTQLENELSHSLGQDLALFRQEITTLIEEEIVGRYFYEAGAIAWGLKKDEQLSKAIEILDNPLKYSSILSGKSGSMVVSSKNSTPVSATIGNDGSETEESV
jgi:carboxyl-terminal processing protease